VKTVRIIDISNDVDLDSGLKGRVREIDLS